MNGQRAGVSLPSVAAPETTLEVRALGDLEVVAGGTPVSFRGAKQRALLAALLLEHGRPVSIERLAEAIWSGSAPEAAQKNIQVYVSGLRKALGDSRIVTRGRGYELVVERGELDLDRFDELVRDAAGQEPDEAAALLRDALGLVRGRPFANVELELWAHSEVDRIEDRILDATELRIDADLALGRHGELVPELQSLVESHPYRERLLWMLMLALYRSGRQTEALEAYRDGATRMRDELGLEPGRPLQELEASILRQDEELDAPPPRQRDVAVARRRRGWKLATAGAVALVAAAVAAAVLGVTRGDSASLASIPPGVAILSATDGSLVAHIPMSEIAQPVEVVTGSGAFWVSNLDPPSTVEVNSSTGGIERRLGSAFPGEPGWPLPDGTVIWFTRQGELVRMDIAEGREVDRFRLVKDKDRFGLADEARCAGSLWVTSNEEGRVIRLDPGTGAVEAQLPIRFPWAIACGEGGLWVTSDAVGLRRIDPKTNRFVATAQVPPPHDNLAVGGGYAWTTNETNGTLYKIDRRGTIVTTYQTGDGARQLSFDDGTVWVANQDVGTVTGIDAATGAARSFQFGHPVQSVAAVNGRILVELLPGRTFEDRIRDLSGRVARLIVPTYVFDPPDPALAWNPWVHMAESATCSQLLRHSIGDGLPGDRLVPDLATSLPRVSADRRTYTFTVRPGRRFAPPSNQAVTADAVRFSIERALSPKLATDVPATNFLDDLVGAMEVHAGKASHVSGIHVSGARISFTLARPSDDFPERVSLPFFCTVPIETTVPQGGVITAPPSAGPYYMSYWFNGEYTILKRNPNYVGPRPARLDAIAFREGISSEHAVARVRSGEWDGAILFEDLLAPGGVVAREARASGGRYRTEELPVRGPAYPGEEGSIHGLFSSRLGCDRFAGVFDLTTLCILDT
jgi:DNA-binding SARP family transcriptional activator/streptogramin lyase